jgi:DNA-binding NarL/FixJ family response regulator
MNIMIIEPCSYTRIGMTSILSHNNNLQVFEEKNILQALRSLKKCDPEILLINITDYCKNASYCHTLKEFLNLCHDRKLYFYIEKSYPDAPYPVQLSENFFILKKHSIPNIISKLMKTSLFSSASPPETKYCLFSSQELLVMKYWMEEMPNYRIARKLRISSCTVYTHKRHLVQKTKVRNRIEFCFIYNFIKHLFPTSRLSVFTETCSFPLIAAKKALID